MRASSGSHGRRGGARRAARGVVLLLGLGSIVTLAAPASAAVAPWRFLPPTTSTFTVAAGAISAGAPTCPSPYIPVGGGVQNATSPAAVSFERVAEYRQGVRGYQVAVHNYGTATLTVTIGFACAHESDVGGLTQVTALFDRDAEGEAGGPVYCPSGTKALLGGADWSTFNTNRRVDLTSPTTDGNGWYATGWSGVAGQLGVEAWCIAAGDLGVAAPNVSGTDVASTGLTTGYKNCPTGQRIVSGGVITSPIGGAADPYTYLGNTEYNAPQGTVNYPAWKNVTYAYGGTHLTIVVWCIPVSVPTATITQEPPAHTNSTSASFVWQGSDPAGEDISWSCSLDFQALPQGTSCAPGAQTSLTGLAAGQHHFTVVVYNASKQSAYDESTWVIDQTAPTAVAPPANPSVSGPLAVTFSEQVTGVTASSVQVRVAGLSTVVAGSVVLSTTGTGATKASWLPAFPLVPGETYAISLTSAVHDLAGNPLAPVTYLVRTNRTVENVSAALREYWDPDTNASASGGAYAVSGTVGSAAAWGVRATAGQTAALYGARRPDGGNADVYVDGVKKATVSFYAASTAWKAKVYTTPALSAGSHRIEVRVLGTKPTGSTGTNVALDYVVIGTTTAQETAAVQAFRRVTTASTQASGGTYDLVTHTTTGDTGGTPSYFVTFKGTGVRFYATKSPSAGTAKVYVDGVLKATVNLRTASVAYRQLAYSVSGLSEARHTIRITCVGTSNGWYSTVGLDFLSVT